MIIWPIACSLIGVINAQAEPFASIGYGVCYHYNVFTYSIHYDPIQIQAVVLEPARWRTMRMTPEQYVLVQYYHDKRKWAYFGGVGARISGGLVYSIGAKYIVAQNASFGTSIYHDSNMTHFIVGVNLEI